MDIILDFDGTLTTHEYPNIGKDVGAIPVLKKLLALGHRFILSTMRSDNRMNDDGTGTTRHTLSEAVMWFAQNGIPLYGVQTNPTQKEWTDSPKAYGHLIIDDAAAGCPIKWDKELSRRPFVDWVAMEKVLEERGFLPKTEPNVDGNA
jgi:hypothetical protein